MAQATGVLPARGAVSTQDAFASLAAATRRTDRPVHDVARALVAAVAARHTSRAAGP